METNTDVGLHNISILRYSNIDNMIITQEENVSVKENIRRSRLPQCWLHIINWVTKETHHFLKEHYFSYSNEQNISIGFLHYPLLGTCQKSSDLLNEIKGIPRQIDKCQNESHKMAAHSYEVQRKS